MLFFALLTATFLAIGFAGIVNVFWSTEESMGVLGYLFFAGIIMTRYGILSAENVLRRSREKIPRLKANIAQWLIIGVFLGSMAWVCLVYLIVIFRLLLT